MKKLMAFFCSNKKISIIIILALLLLILVSLTGAESEEKSQSAPSLSSYEKSLEADLSELCSSIEGVGKCRVYVSFYKGEESVYKNGVLVEYNPPRVLGVSVVCQGGERADVKRELTELLCSLFDLGSNRVKISKLK